MNQTIQELWNGNIAPCEHCGAQDRQANILYGEVRRSREAVANALQEEHRKLLEQYGQCWEDYLFRMMEEAFRDGFVLGSRLSAEIYSQE